MTDLSSAQVPGDNSQQEQLLIYDGQCRLCVTAKRGLERANRAARGTPVRYVAYQSQEAASCLGEHYRPGRPDVAFLVDTQGRVEQGLNAFLPLLPGLPGGRLLLMLMRLSLVRPVASAMYWLIARYRYRLFGKVPYHTGRDEQR